MRAVAQALAKRLDLEQQARRVPKEAVLAGPLVRALLVRASLGLQGPERAELAQTWQTQAWQAWLGWLVRLSK
jgi:hypothetical protein